MKRVVILAQRVGLIIVLTVMGVLAFPNHLSAQPLSYNIRETIPIPFGKGVLAVGDMDGDGVLDIVLTDATARTISVRERDSSTFVNRLTISEPSQLRGPFVGKVDGDGLPEIFSGNRTGGGVRIFESSGDNTYALRHTLSMGNFIENTKTGDSDGNGQREFLIARERQPNSELRILEATSDNTYVDRGVLADVFATTGLGGNAFVAGTADLDGDGLIETVFSDDNYQPTVRRIYVYEGGSLVFHDPSAGILPSAVGDTDCNGLGEMIGIANGDLRILESTGSLNNFQEVFNAPSSGYRADVVDVDKDGCAEFVRSIDNGFGSNNVFTIATRTGSTLTDIYDSGLLLQGFPGDIREILSIGDTNGDGILELAVVQGNQIHILEQGGATVPETCNADVTLVPLPATFKTDPTPVDNGPAGTFTFDAKMTNIGSSDLESIQTPILILSNGNMVVDFPGGPSPAEVGDTLVIPIPAASDYSDGVLGMEEMVDVTHTVGLAEFASFEFFVEVECVKGNNDLGSLRNGPPTTTDDYDEVVATNE